MQVITIHSDAYIMQHTPEKIQYLILTLFNLFAFKQIIYAP